MPRPPLFARVAGAILVASGACANARGQDFQPPAYAVAIAVTYCHNPDSVAPAFTVTFIDTRLVGTDSLPEILIHERAHERMNRDSLRAVGHCPGGPGQRARLDREIYAYCISDSVRVRRTHDPIEAGRSTVGRLLNQFGDSISAQEIVWRWAKGCPTFAWAVP